jgi:hypothetical protein
MELGAAFMTESYGAIEEVEQVILFQRLSVLALRARSTPKRRLQSPTLPPLCDLGSYFWNVVLAAFGEILRRACNHLIPHAPGWRWSNFPERC